MLPKRFQVAGLLIAFSSTIFLSMAFTPHPKAEDFAENEKLSGAGLLYKVLLRPGWMYPPS